MNEKRNKPGAAFGVLIGLALCGLMVLAFSRLISGADRSHWFPLDARWCARGKR
jgi:hypothetical protein